MKDKKKHYVYLAIKLCDFKMINNDLDMHIQAKTNDRKVRHFGDILAPLSREKLKMRLRECDAGYVGYTRGHLFVRVDGYRSKTSSVRKHYDNRHPGRIPDDLHSCFKVLKKCQNKFDCLVNEMLLIKQLRPCLNVQSDSICAKVFV